MLPFTRLLVGTTLGTWAAIVPLSANLVPFFARIAQVSLNDVDPGLVEAARAMGCRRLHIVRHVLLPEALPGIIGGMTVSVIAMINASAMAGAVGAGGLGDLAIRYGYERYETRVMFEVIVILIALVSIVQFTGEWLSRRADHSADAAMRRRMSGQGGRQQAGQLLRAQLVLFADQGVDAGLVLPIARQVVVALEQQLSAARDPVGAIVVEQRDHLAEFVEDARFQVPGPVHVAQPRRPLRRHAVEHAGPGVVVDVQRAYQRRHVVQRLLVALAVGRQQAAGQFENHAAFHQARVARQPARIEQSRQADVVQILDVGLVLREPLAGHGLDRALQLAVGAVGAGVGSMSGNAPGFSAPPAMRRSTAMASRMPALASSRWRFCSIRLQAWPASPNSITRPTTSTMYSWRRGSRKRLPIENSAQTSSGGKANMPSTSRLAAGWRASSMRSVPSAM